MQRKSGMTGRTAAYENLIEWPQWAYSVEKLLLI